MLVIVLVRTQGAEDLQALYQQSQLRLNDLIQQLGTPKPGLTLHDIAPRGKSALVYRSNFERQAFEKAVDQCVEYIRAGDIFQVVISQRLQVEIRSDPFEIYRTLYERNKDVLHALDAMAKEGK